MNNRSHTHNKNTQQGLAARRTAVTIVTKVVDEHQTIDQITDPVSGNRFYLDLNGKDQALAKAIALTCLRHLKPIQFILSKIYERKPPQKARILIHSIHVAAAQILYMQVPTSAAVNLAIAMIRSDRRAIRFAGFANAVLRNLDRRRDELLEKSQTVHPYPDWIYKKLSSDHGKEKIAKSGKVLLQQPVLDLTLKPNTALPASLAHIALPMGAKRLLEQDAISQLEGFQDGNWWVQDVAASLPAKLMGDLKDKSVADLCAAPGGKTMQLASLGANVTAIDQSEKRLKRLEENLDRTSLSAKIVVTDILEWQSEQLFEAILLDAPCTAIGTARKHPDVMWNKKPEDLAALVKLQSELIAKACTMLKPGGTLIYANCSLFKDEGENLIPKLSLENCSISPIEKSELPGLENCINGQGTVRCLPHLLEATDDNGNGQSGIDGFFIARFVKTNAK